MIRQSFFIFVLFTTRNMVSFSFHTVVKLVELDHHDRENFKMNRLNIFCLKALFISEEGVHDHVTLRTKARRVIPKSCVKYNKAIFCTSQNCFDYFSIDFCFAPLVCSITQRIDGDDRFFPHACAYQRKVRRRGRGLLRRLGHKFNSCVSCQCALISCAFKLH